MTTSATPVVDNDYRKHQPTMEDNTETPLQPGPYLSASGKPLVVIDATVDVDGEVRALYGASPLDWLYCTPGSITPADHWPEWWPFQDAALPERTPQVGDWVRHRGWSDDRASELIIGNHFGHWQMVSPADGDTRAWRNIGEFTVVPAPEGVEA